MEMNNLTGSVKVAILTNAVGRAAAQPILDRMDEQERQMIYRLQGRLSAVPQSLVEKVAREFIQLTGAASSGSAVEQAASNEHPAEETEEAKRQQRRISNLQAIQDIESAQLLQLIKDEHPQTIAVILVNLKPDIASDILGMLPDEVKTDVAFRIANLDKVLSGMVDEIDKVFEEILKNNDQSATQEAGGVGRLAEILNQIDGGSVEQIIDEIEENDPDLADEIKQMMFVFEDVVLVDDKGLQKVLRSVESQELAIALKAASEDVKAKIFRNMSERAAEILKEEMEVSGAVRMKDVTDAQQKITRIIQDMERKGELIISGRGGEEFIG
jgi:flagellar motor switch protein FliG